MLKLTTVFPALEDEFINVLTERIVANGFTNERLIDAVNNLIDNFKYRRPSIADIIAFDCRIKLYTRREFMDAQANGTPHTEFTKHYVDGELFFVKKSDCKRYNFKPKSEK